jgi:hypothetical protein
MLEKYPQKWKKTVAQKEELFYAALCKVDIKSLRQFWRRIYETILNNYSEEEVIKQYLNWVKKYDMKKKI